MFEFGEDASLLSEYAWQFGNTPIGTTPEVGTRRPNRWGFLDLYGGVAEWCADWWHPGYEGAPADGSAWIPGPREYLRVIRGGCCRVEPSRHLPLSAYRSAARGYANRSTGSPFFGVRPAFSLSPDQEHFVEPYLVEGAK